MKHFLALSSLLALLFVVATPFSMECADGTIFSSEYTFRDYWRGQEILNCQRDTAKSIVDLIQEQSGN